jgi:hypothetical protein
MGIMRGFLAIIFCLTGLSLFGQTSATQVAPGVREQLDTLLNKPAMAEPVGITPLGRNWFRLATDAHVITGDADFEQVAAVLLDLENTTKVFNGKKSKLMGHIVSQTADETIADFTMVSFGPLGIQIKTPYRASVKNVAKTETKISMEIWQLASDSAANKEIKNLFATRYAEEIIITGKKYTYIRIYALDDVNASVLPGARGILEHAAIPSNIEALELIIAAARKR